MFVLIWTLFGHGVNGAYSKTMDSVSQVRLLSGYSRSSVGRAAKSAPCKNVQYKGADSKILYSSVKWNQKRLVKILTARAAFTYGHGGGRVKLPNTQACFSSRWTPPIKSSHEKYRRNLKARTANNVYYLSDKQNRHNAPWQNINKAHQNTAEYLLRTNSSRTNFYLKALAAIYRGAQLPSGAGII